MASMEIDFWIPDEARWQGMQNNVKQLTIVKLVDDPVSDIKRDKEFGNGRHIRSNLRSFTATQL